MLRNLEVAAIKTVGLILFWMFMTLAAAVLVPVDAFLWARRRVRGTDVDGGPFDKRYWKTAWWLIVTDPINQLKDI